MTLRAAFASLAVPLLAVSLWVTAAAQSAAPDSDADAAARTAIWACIHQITNVPIGLHEIEEHCPDLPAVLQAAGIRPLIIDSSRTSFDLSSLRQLPNLIHPTQGPAPAVAALAPILRELLATPVVPRTWWQRLWDWLVEHLTPKKGAKSSTSWMTGLLRLLPKLQWLWTGTIWATVAALLGGVAIIVLREVRAMGRRSMDDPVAAEATGMAGRADSRLALLRQMPLGKRPAQLFAMLITRLVAAGRLPPDRSLTHREVVRRVRLDDADQRQLIDSLARLSERQLYSGSSSTPAGIEEVLARGEDLYTTGVARPVEP
jgi:Domain of unknown function (DUF4129)